MSKGRAIYTVIITIVLIGFAAYFLVSLIDSYNDINDAQKEVDIAEKELADAKKEQAEAEKELQQELEEATSS